MAISEVIEIKYNFRNKKLEDILVYQSLRN